MAVTAASSEELYVGAGDVFYDKNRDGILVPVGATQDDNVFRLTQTFFVPDLNGTVSPLVGTDYLQEEIAELEVSIPELSPDTLALSVPGSTSTVRSSADAGGTPFSSTLAAATVIGQNTAIKVAAITNLAVGDYIRVGTSPTREFRRVQRVGTAGAGGTGIDVDFPLQFAHASGVAAVETEGDGATVITRGEARRIPTSSYHDWVLVVYGLDGRQARFWTRNAIMTENPEFSAGDDSNLAPRLTVQARRTAAQVATAAWQIDKLAAAA